MKSNAFSILKVEKVSFAWIDNGVWHTWTTKYLINSLSVKFYSGSINIRYRITVEIVNLVKVNTKVTFS